MDDTKNFLQSKTIWGAILAVIGAAMSASGFDATPLYGLDGEIVTVVGGALAAYGRIRAVKKIK